MTPIRSRGDIVPALPRPIEAELPFTRAVVGIELAGGERVDLHVVEHGDPRGQPVLFLHGNRSWSATWRYVMCQCASPPSLRLVALDLPGFGLSGDLPAPRRTLGGYAETVALVVEALALADAVVVVHETGALIAAEAGWLLLERDARGNGDGGAPGRLSFAGAVLVAASPFSTGPDALPSTLHRFGALPRLRDAVFVATGRPRLALGALQSQRSRFAASAADIYAWPLRAASRRRAMVDLAALAADRAARLGAAQWLLDFPGPVALVWGHRDPLMGAQDFAALERELPYARIWRTEAGHFVQEEEPDAIVEAIRWTAQRIGIAADPEGIPANFLPGLGSGDYVEVGRSQVRRLIDYAGLEPGDRILDVGCGLGRTARALRETMGPAGRYDGVDVVRDVVRWCQQNLTRVDRRLRFHHAPVRSGLYSPQGSLDARNYRFPFDDESFDFVVAESLFTHLTAEEAARYLVEIGRVMRPGATLCVSVFLLDPGAREAIAAVRSDHRFATACGAEWIEDPEQPLLAVAFAADWFTSALAAAGLEPARPLAPGAWRGALESVSYQDTVVAVKMSRSDVVRPGAELSPPSK